jgi:serine/threonine protein kinase
MDTQRNLLVGVLALQCHLVTSERLVEALEIWVKDKRRPLDKILLEQGDLQNGSHATLLALVKKHLAQYGNLVDQSLAAFAVDIALKDGLLSIADPELQAAVSLLSLGAASNDHAVATLDVTVPQTKNPTSSPSAVPNAETILYSEERNVSQSGAATEPATSTGAAKGLRFRILRPHAKGGLGEVFVAQDQEVNREVALKEIQSRYAGRKVSRARFLLEAEITGGLEHPGIVPVYGLGTYPDGRPYYAMRFIKGDGLDSVIKQFHNTDWSKKDVKERTLELRRLLRCFIDVCNAIEYAHSRGVLHRDLKPANIMLGKYGETLVVDWGLAKMVNRPDLASGAEEPQLQPASESASAGTRLGTAVGTPSFMSPEQAAGQLDQIGPKSDVYNLGATLYMLLIGTPPFVDRDVDLILERVKRGQFIRPRQFDPQVPKPLEAICLRAMALSPSHRYPSPRALADDLEHWLADEATMAYQEPWRERCLRWARRHKTWTQAAVATVSIVAITAVVASLLINQSRRNESIARQSADESFLQARRTVDDFFTRISENKLLNVPGLQPLRKELLEAASQYYQGFIKQRENDPSVRKELAETHYRLGLIAGEVDNKAAALKSLDQALALQQALRKEDLHSVELSVALANTCNAIGSIRQEMGELPEALRWFEEARTIRESLVQRSPQDALLQRKLANSHNNLAAIFARQGKRDSADAEFEQANTMRANLARDNPNSPVYQRDLAQGYFNLAQYKKEADDLTGALEANAQAIAAYQLLVDKDPRVIDHRRELAWAYRVRGDMQADMGEPQNALASFEHAREIAERLAQQNPLLLELQADVAAIYANIGRLKQRTAESPQAVDWYTRARTIRDQLVAADPTVERYRMDQASSELHLGMAQLDIGSLAEALDNFQRALRGYTALAEKMPDDVALQDGLAQTQRNIGLVYRAQGDPTRALMAFEETRKIFERLAQHKSASLAIKMGLADALLNIAVDSRAVGKLDEAFAAAHRAVEIQQAVAIEHPNVVDCQYVYAETLYMRGLLELGSGDYPAAQESYQTVVVIAQKLSHEDDNNLKYRSMLGTALDKQAVALWLLKRKDEAIESAKQATDMLRSSWDAAPQVVQYRLNLSDNYFNRAKFERDLGQPADAVAITLERKKLWPDDAQQLYRVACELALSAQSLDSNTAKLSSTQREQRTSYISKSIQSLKEAIAAGWSDLEAIRKESQLKVLRKDPEFQKLLAKPVRNAR